MPIKPIIRKPVSRFRKLAVAGLASAALLGVGGKAIAQERSQGVRRPAVAEQNIGKRDLERIRLFSRTPEQYLEEFAISLTRNPSLMISTFNNYAPQYKKEVLLQVKTLFLKMRTTQSKREVFEQAKQNFGKYPVLLKAVLEGIARNKTFVK